MPKLDRAYNYIVDFKRLHDGNSPTMREIADELKPCSTSQVKFYLDRLEAMEKIRRRLGRACAIEVIGGKWVGP